MTNTKKTRFIMDETTAIRLVNQAKEAKSEDARDLTIHNLWALCGEYVTNMVVSKSYKIDSDFSLHGKSPKERQAELSLKAFHKFRDCALKFDPSFGVPFLAWVAKKIGWRLLDDKRANTKRGKREKECAAKAYRCHGEDLLTDEASRLQACDNRRLIARCRKVIMERAPKLLPAFDAMEKDSKENSRCCDSHFAKTLGCSKVYAGILKKKIHDILVDCGMDWAPDSVTPAATDDHCYSLPGCSPYVYKDKD